MPGRKTMKDAKFITILLLVSVFLFLFGLGNMALTDPDEAFYAQTAKEMLNASEWVTPTIFGETQFEKPILFYLSVVVSFIIFGVNEFAARLPSALFGILGVLGVYYLGRLLFSRFCGFLSALSLATCIQYVMLSRACVTDMMLTVFILFCMLFFLLGWTKERKFFYVMASVMAALAVLTKGPIGIFIPAVVFGTYIIMTRQWDKVRRIPFLWCALAFLAVSLPWYLAVIRIHGTSFISEFFGFQNITRFLEPEHRIGISPVFYIPVILGGFFPWSVFLISGSWCMFKNKDHTSVIKSNRLFLLVWFLMVFLFFSASSTKLVTYIFPLFPVLALVSGRFWERFITEGRENPSLYKHMRASYIVFAVVGLVGLSGVYIVVNSRYSQALNVISPALGVFAVGVVLSSILFFKDKRAYSFYSIALAITLLPIPLVAGVFPFIDEFESSKAISYKAKELVSPEVPFGGESDKRRGIAFYMDRADIKDVHPYPDLITFMARKERVWCILQDKHYRQLKAEKPGIVSEPVFRSGKNVLVTNKSLNSR